MISRCKLLGSQMELLSFDTFLRIKNNRMGNFTVEASQNNSFDNPTAHVQFKHIVKQSERKLMVCRKY